jgi:hypothetical protein
VLSHGCRQSKIISIFQRVGSGAERGHPEQAARRDRVDVRRSTRCDRLPAFIERITVVGTIPGMSPGQSNATVALMLDSQIRG